MVRTLGLADVPAALRLSEAAGWNQTAGDWARLIQLGAGCFGIDVDDALSATATGICYGMELGWIGMVLTAPEHRGRGFARALMRHTLEYLDGRGVRCVKLDASDMGRPLYEQFGFVTECAVERWHRPGGSRTGQAVEPAGGQMIDFAADRESFGADRSWLLKELAKREWAAVPGGYAMSRPGREATYFGPCVVGSVDAARDLLAWFLNRHGHRPAYWDLLPDNRDVVDLARACGFSAVRRLSRMVYGRDGSQFASVNSRVLAIAGFEYG